MKAEPPGDFGLRRGTPWHTGTCNRPYPLLAHREKRKRAESTARAIAVCRPNNFVRGFINYIDI